jgi:hypothetical protein
MVKKGEEGIRILHHAKAIHKMQTVATALSDLQTTNTALHDRLHRLRSEESDLLMSLDKRQRRRFNRVVQRNPDVLSPEETDARVVPHTTDSPLTDYSRQFSQEPPRGRKRITTRNAFESLLNPLCATSREERYIRESEMSADTAPTHQGSRTTSRNR